MLHNLLYPPSFLILFWSKIYFDRMNNLRNMTLSFHKNIMQQNADNFKNRQPYFAALINNVTGNTDD